MITIAVVAAVAGYWVLSSAVVWASTRMHEGYLAHDQRIRADERAAHQRFTRKFSTSMEHAQAVLVFESKDYPGAAFIHRWANRITARGWHPLTARHRAAVSRVTARA